MRRAPPSALLAACAGLACAALACAGLACDGPTPPATPEPVPLEAVDVRALRSAPTPVDVALRERRLVVRNVITAPDPCHEVTAALDRTPGRLRLAVEARRTRSYVGACVAVVGAFAYTATLPPLAAGSYRLTVEHTQASVPRTDVALDTLVAVP